MAINTAGQTAAQTFSDGITKYASGSVTFDATAITATDFAKVTCGFIPRYFMWCNDTDRVMGEWRDGMADNSCIKTAAAGTRTLEVTGVNRGIIVGTPTSTNVVAGATPGPGEVFVSQNATLGLILASKVCRWQAWG